MAQGLVHFMHGKESGPGGRKIAALAAVARARAWSVESLDYSHTTDPGLRLAQLLDACVNIHGLLLLVGSSMGGWVAAEAAARLTPAACSCWRQRSTYRATQARILKYLPNGPRSCMAGTTTSSLAIMRSASHASVAAPCTSCRATTGSTPGFPYCVSCLTPSCYAAKSAHRRS